MAYSKIILKNDDNSKLLYPRTLSTLLVDEDEVTFEPQRLLSTSTGLNITRAVSGDVISAALTVNGTLPVLDDTTGMWNFNLTDSNTIIDTSIPVTPADDHVPSTKLMADNLPVRYQAITTLTYTSRDAFDADWQNSVLLNKVRVLYAKLQNLGITNNYVVTKLYLRQEREPKTPNNCIELFVDSGEFNDHSTVDLEYIPSSVFVRKTDGTMMSAFQWMHDNYNSLFYYDDVDIVLVIDVIPNVIMI